MLFADEDEIIARLIGWAEAQPLVRAMVLTSSRAVPGAAVDVFSDYDVILALSEVQPFFAERDWQEAFGKVLAAYRDPLELEAGFLKSGYVTQFEDGLKIDFSLWPAGLLQHVAASERLPQEFDAGYRVLLDKDGLAAGLQPPTFRGYIPASPSESEYQEAIEVFFLEAIYAAKLLWRDDLVAVRYVLDQYMKHEHLLPMLVWRGELDHGWALKPGPYGRGFKKWMRPDLWAQLESTYTGAGLAENWEALFRTMALMRTAAREVGERLGFAYPDELERRVVAYLQRVMNMEAG